MGSVTIWDFFFGGLGVALRLGVKTNLNNRFLASRQEVQKPQRQISVDQNDLIEFLKALTGDDARREAITATQR